jgi:hypothetical protein
MTVINFLRGIERDWKDWSAGKNKTPLDIFCRSINRYRDADF